MFYDMAKIDGPARITRDGYLVADALVGKADNIQAYLASELELKDRAPTEIVRIFRPAAEVFHKDALASLAHRPITIEHPAGIVDAKSWKEHSVGDVGGEILRDGEFLRVPMKIMDQAAVAKVRSTHGEFSLGYTAKVEMTPGQHEGQHYDGAMSAFQYNHLAAVRDARGGAELRIVDERTIPPKENEVKTITYDGLPVNLGDAAAVEALIAKLTNAKDAAAKDVTDTKALLDAETGKVAALEKHLADAKASLEPAAIEKRVADRAAFVATAKAIKSGLVTDGKSEADIRKEVVTAELGDAAATMSDDQVAGAYAVLAKGAKPVSDSDTIHNIGAPKVIGDAAATFDAEQSKRKQQMSDAWKQPASGAAQ